MIEHLNHAVSRQREVTPHVQCLKRPIISKLIALGHDARIIPAKFAQAYVKSDVIPENSARRWMKVQWQVSICSALIEGGSTPPIISGAILARSMPLRSSAPGSYG